MQGRKTALIVRMNDAHRDELLSWLRAQKTPGGLAKRAWAMLLLADGQSYAATGRQVGLRERHVRKWAKRFLRDGPAGLADKQRPGRRPVFSPRSGYPSGQDRLRVAG
jgi:hypothetical protein